MAEQVAPGILCCLFKTHFFVKVCFWVPKPRLRLSRWPQVLFLKNWMSLKNKGPALWIIVNICQHYVYLVQCVHRLKYVVSFIYIFISNIYIYMYVYSHVICPTTNSWSFVNRSFVYICIYIYIYISRWILSCCVWGI